MEKKLLKGDHLSAFGKYSKMLLQKKHHNLPALFLFLLSSFTVSAQTTVTGTVRDTSGAGLPGVSVYVKGSSSGNTTDADGRYSIRLLKANGTLVFSFLGFTTREVTVGNQSTVNVILQLQDADKLHEVVVVGYGKQSRELITSSISKLDPKVLEHAARSNVATALQGTIPGLRVLNNSGQPGNSPNIVLRGGASINTPGSPLVVVDGIIRDMNDLNPADIESMQVLKDAASSSIYGSQANNGIILITTKRARAGSSQVTYNVRMGTNRQRKNIEYLDAHDYLYYNRLGMRTFNAVRAQGGIAPVSVDAQYGYGTSNPTLFDVAKITSTNRSQFQSFLGQGWQWMIDPYNDIDTIVFKDHSGEIYDETINSNAHTQDHTLEFSGGNDKGNFRASLGYYNEDGIITGTKYERISGTLSGSYKIKSNLEVSGLVSFSNSSRPPLYIGESLLFHYIDGIWPTFRPLDSLGNPSSGNFEGGGNPRYYLDRYIRKNNVQRTTFSLGAKWKLTKDLLLSAQGNVHYQDDQNESFNKAIQLQTTTTPDVTRAASASKARRLRQQHNLTLDYTKAFGNHHLSVLVGGEAQAFTFDNLSAAGRGAPTDDIYTLNSAATLTSISSSKTSYSILSGFSRVNYDYDGKYLLTASIRYDGISKLDANWGAFPGISAGWNMHREPFFADLQLDKYISAFKPRISYGVTGNVAGVTDYEVQGAYTIQTLYQGNIGYLNTDLVNKSLRWEKSKSLEIGADIGLLKNRVTLILNYFRRTTGDLLTFLRLPEYSGFTQFRTNLGDFRNSGFESDVNISILKMRNGLTWDLGFNASFVKNKILKLPYNGNEKNRQNSTQAYDPKTGQVIWVGGLQEGETIGDIYAYQQVRIFKDWEDVNKFAGSRYDKISNMYGPVAYANLANKLNAFPIEPGDVYWADLDGNNIIDSYDRVKVGNMYPDWTGGFNTSVSFKRLSLYTAFDYALGHTIFNADMATLLAQSHGTLNNPALVKQMWTPENPNSDLPRYTYGDNGVKKNIGRVNGPSSIQDNNNSRFYEKGDYLAWRELTISYSLPTSIISGLKMSSLKAYVTGQNLKYLTKYTGTSPEVGGIDVGRYPVPRTIIFGLNVSF